MQHNPELIEVKEIADEIIAVRVRCCDDPLTDSWHTIHAAHKLNEADLGKQLDEHKDRVAQRHEGKGKAKSFLTSKIKAQQ